ncbi:MAG: LIC12162 family protein [Proteobacteria bacterium]|nr:LIC12162 family protein [Pseudomonadota bacterium]
MTSISLCTTALSDFWDTTANRIVMLGQWCLRNDRRDDWRDLDYEVLPHPWDDREAMHRAAGYEESVYQSLLECLAVFMNQVHGESHGLDYWRLILGPWLLHYVQVIHERHLCLEAALERHPGLRTIGLAAGSFRVPRHTDDHLLGGMDDPYNLQIYTALLQAMGFDFSSRQLEWEWAGWAPVTGGSLPKRLSRKLRTWWRAIGPFWARRSPVVLVDMYLPLATVLRFSLHTGLRALWAEMPHPDEWPAGPDFPASHPLRAELAGLKPERTDRFTQLVIKTLPDNLPRIYMEGYRVCRDWVVRCWKRPNVKKLVTSNGLESNEPLKFVAAELKERGARLIVVQHGGSYGSARYNPNERLERQAADEFWSWGWGEDQEGVRPVVSPKLSRMARMRQTANRNGRGPAIFYVSNAFARYHYRTWSCPTAAGQARRYFEWQFRFLQALAPGVRQNLIFRPYYPYDYGWSLVDMVKQACPDIVLDEAGHDYTRGIAEAELVVCDVNQTTMLETLTSDIPTIAFWDAGLWELRPEATPFFTRLHEAGILHFSPGSAAEAMNQIWPDVRTWWDGPEARAARREFSLRFARQDPAWMSQWWKALSS